MVIQKVPMTIIQTQFHSQNRSLLALTRHKIYTQTISHHFEDQKKKKKIISIDHIATSNTKIIQAFITSNTSNLDKHEKTFAYQSITLPIFLHFVIYKIHHASNQIKSLPKSKTHTHTQTFYFSKAPPK